ncbi:MAG: hypothetical protein CEN89_674 [Candidatus Berkelbacteria bacterium Licking1014_7]|uniref:Uncharacterized protein n=1 Tax=Candidatus Berkelbacteria bacterium Licking1014_7 TaxID=2017147 RepID=A0A554LI03_9BACT|nr:MAG: hypothetical protein CEN89_674 [Candidatus Berkelbacteria bacterium Licking1014_7]
MEKKFNARQNEYELGENETSGELGENESGENDTRRAIKWCDMAIKGFEQVTDRHLPNPQSPPYMMPEIKTGLEEALSALIGLREMYPNDVDLNSHKDRVENYLLADLNRPADKQILGRENFTNMGWISLQYCQQLKAKLIKNTRSKE